MHIEKPSQLFNLPFGIKISKRNLYAVIQNSKIEGSTSWDGKENIIGNTPQQGINWVGHFPDLQGVIIKTRGGAYKDDGWEDTSKTSYRYSFKSRMGIINLAEKANAVLINQPKFGYPVHLFIEVDDFWEYQGAFHISSIGESFVKLEIIKGNEFREEAIPG